MPKPKPEPKIEVRAPTKHWPKPKFVPEPKPELVRLSKAMPDSYASLKAQNFTGHLTSAFVTPEGKNKLRKHQQKKFQ